MAEESSHVPAARPIPLLRVLLTALAILGLIALSYIAGTPGPPPSHALVHIETMHNSMFPKRLDRIGADRKTPRDAPRLNSSIASQLERAVISWDYSWGQDRITLHRTAAAIELPATSQSLRLSGAQYDVFELKDLTFLVWQDGQGRTLLVVGTSPVARLGDFATWARQSAVQKPREAESD